MRQIVLLLLVTFVGFVCSEPDDDGHRILSDNHRGVGPPPYINRIRYPRYAEPEPQGSIVLQGQQPLSGPDRRPSYNFDYNHNIWHGKNGQLDAYGGGSKLPGQRFDPHVGIQGTWRFRRSADPQGSIVLGGSKLPGQRFDPYIGIQGKWRFRRSADPQGSIVLGGSKLPGQRFDPYIGIQGKWRFRRSADPQGSIVLQGQQPLSGPDRRPSYNLDYQHNIWEGKNGHVSAYGGGQKLPGQRFEPHAGIQGTWRFRRSADPQGSIVLQGQQPLSGPDRRPSYNIDYQHKIWEGRNGQVNAYGGGQKMPGQRFDPHVGIQGTWRFRRSADPQGSIVLGGSKVPGQRFDPYIGIQGKWRFRRSADPQGSIVLQGQQPLSGPDRRPSYNLDYHHNIWEGKNGHVSAYGGGQKLPGQRFEPHAGIQGTWRFRRSADPQGSVVLQGQKPLSGPDRRPSINLDYQHKIWEGKNGHVSAYGGGQKLPGQRFEPHAGIQGTWRFRRSAESLDDQ